MINCKGGSQPQIKLKDMKESKPDEVAEYSKAKDIDNDPVFIWWVPYTLGD